MKEIEEKLERNLYPSGIFLFAPLEILVLFFLEIALNKLKSLFEIAKAFEANMRTNYLTSMVPGVICLGGVFLFHMGVVGGLIVYYTAKMVGLTNTMLPLIKHENS